MNDEFGVAGFARATTSVVTGVVVTRVAGEVDMASVDAVRAEVAKQLDQRPASFVLDLSGLTFTGSVGLAMLIEEQRHAYEVGAAFVVVANQAVVLKPLEISGVRDLVVVCPSVPDAISLLRGRRASG